MNVEFHFDFGSPNAYLVDLLRYQGIDEVVAAVQRRGDHLLPIDVEIWPHALREQVVQQAENSGLPPLDEPIN